MATLVVIVCLYKLETFTEVDVRRNDNSGSNWFFIC
jgi:hypothetical protein